MHLVFLLLFLSRPRCGSYMSELTLQAFCFILVFLLTLSPLIQMFCSFASVAVERRFLLLMSSSSPISVPTFFAFLYSLPDLDSVVCSVLSALTSKLYFFNVFCTSAISANSNPIKLTSSAYTISVGRVFFQNQKSVVARWFSLLSGLFLSIWKIKRDLDYLPLATVCCFRMVFLLLHNLFLCL